MTTELFFGVDVSKGYVDICCINQSGSRLGEILRFDDTAVGHKEVEKNLTGLRSKYPEAKMTFGLESSGGLERNWATFFRKYANPFNERVFVLNPLAVKKFLDRSLHRSITDKTAAQGIAQYLRFGIRPEDVPSEESLLGQLSLYRHLRNVIDRSAQMQNEMQSLLPSVQPELVQFCRNGLPDWILEILQKWPTAPALANAEISELDEIPYKKIEAQKLIANAKISVGSQRDSFTGITVSNLAGEILHTEKMIQRMKDELVKSMDHDEGAKIMESIIGIGAWSAACLRLEIGKIERFHSAEALVAYSGLDPRICQSGDSTKHVGISRMGRRQIRAILYPLVLTAIRHNPAIKEFYSRLRAKGKKHMISATACMRKMLHIIYGCWISGKLFDREYENKKCSNKPISKSKESNEQSMETRKINVIPLDAPISRREASKRRKATIMPQTGICRRERGPDVASEIHSK